ncbi:MAG: cbb3-type cytochrome c oxidase subunit II, partial [Acidimicrobiia bacterium]
PSAPPVLVGRNERFAGTVAGAVALLALSLLVGFWVASTPADSNLAYTSEFAYSAIALTGQDVYRSEGCAACHTQVVRPIVADATLGGVSMSDTNQVIGTRRIGPDLAHVGSRVETDADLYAVLDGGAGHPPYRGLSQGELDSLVAYLLESR